MDTKDIWRLWFVTDIHGANASWRRVLNSFDSEHRPDVVVVGGDITGKLIVPFVRQDDFGYQFTIDGASQTIRRDQFDATEHRLSDGGLYPLRCGEAEAKRLSFDPSHYAKRLIDLQVQRVREWMALADECLPSGPPRLFVNAGNDDPFEIDEIIDLSARVERPEGTLVRLPFGVTMVSMGATTETPWHTHRERSELELAETIGAYTGDVRDFSTCIFNLHCPPKGTQLDLAPALDKTLRKTASVVGLEYVHAGSSAVREAIETLRPMVGLHGHIHEQHVMQYLSTTPCYNPGSNYHLGTLQGVLLVFARAQLVRHILTIEDSSASTDHFDKSLLGLLKDGLFAAALAKLFGA